MPLAVMIPHYYYHGIFFIHVYDNAKSRRAVIVKKSLKDIKISVNDYWLFVHKIKMIISLSFAMSIRRLL